MSRRNESSGINPMTWDCEQRGCFNKKMRPKIEMFAECLPGRIAFSDVDAIVEIKGNLLVMEWKTGRHLPRGQALLYQRWTGNSPTVAILVVGDAEHMTVEEIAYIDTGKIGPWVPKDLDGLKNLISDWGRWARMHPAPSDSRKETTQ